VRAMHQKEEKFYKELYNTYFSSNASIHLMKLAELQINNYRIQ
jgi:hypothetical protein